MVGFSFFLIPLAVAIFFLYIGYTFIDSKRYKKWALTMSNFNGIKPNLTPTNIAFARIVGYGLIIFSIVVIIIGFIAARSL